MDSRGYGNKELLHLKPLDKDFASSLVSGFVGETLLEALAETVEALPETAVALAGIAVALAGTVVALIGNNVWLFGNIVELTG